MLLASKKYIKVYLYSCVFGNLVRILLNIESFSYNFLSIASSMNTYPTWTYKTTPQLLVI